MRALAMLAQIGLGQGAAGGVVVLMIVAAFAVLGLSLAIVFGISLMRSEATRARDVVLLLVGLVLMTPALWLVGAVYIDAIPRRKSWDFSASRSARLLGENDHDTVMRERVGYTYSGNIHSTVTLSPTRYWSGKARSVYFRVGSGDITSIQWRSHSLDARHAYEEARRVMKELAVDAQAARDLDDWHAQVIRGGRRYFSHDTRLAPDAKIEISVTSLEQDAPLERRWILDVGVWWDDRAIAP